MLVKNQRIAGLLTYILLYHKKVVMPTSFSKKHSPAKKRERNNMIKKYKKKNGEIAYKLVAYLGVDPATGKQVRTTRQGFKSEREAKRAEIRLIEQYEAQNGWKKVDATTYNDVALLWLEQYATTVKPSTYMVAEESYISKIKPHFGHLQINKISVMHCQKLLNELSRFSCYKNYISIANRIFKFAVNLSLIDRNPMDRTIRPKCTFVPKRESFENFYTKDELNIFLDIVKKHKKPRDLVFYRILAFGGLRVSEALALEEKDFDFKNNTIDVNKTIARTKNGYVLQPPKTKKSKRIISMDAETMLLAKRYCRSLATPLHSPKRLFNIRSGAIRTALIDISKKHKLKLISPHGFRHTHASLLYDAGVPAKVAQERLGHAKISITLDLYTHLSKNQKAAGVKKLFDYIAI